MASEQPKVKPEAGVGSFMVSGTGVGQSFGDLLSSELSETERGIRVGLLATGYFEFWPMYPTLKGQVEQDAKIVLDRLSKKHDIVYTGLVDTLDKAVQAGKMLRDENIDLLIMAYRTYLPDFYLHHLLNYLEGIPLLIFASQERGKFDFHDNYQGCFRNGGIMAQVQLVAGFRKMGTYRNRLEVVAGTIYDDEAYRSIDRYIDVVTIYRRLKSMTIGLIGNVFRGMFDFEYDRTKIKGTLGPEIISISIDHLVDEFEKATPDDSDVQAMMKKAHETYAIEGIGEEDLERTVRVGVALKRLVERFRLDGVALLGQHYVESKFGTEPFFGINELDRDGKCLGITEGDVIGLVMMKILQHLAGCTPFQLEFSEFNVEDNAWMLLGHGHGDPNEARGDVVRLSPAPEHWGHVGTGVSSHFVPKPGPCTLAHFIEDADGWRMFVSGGEIMDLPPLPIDEVHALVKVERPILEYTEKVIKLGVPHHAITVRGDVRHELEQLADLMAIPVVAL